MADQSAAHPVERFHPTSGVWLGWVGIVGLLGSAVIVLWSSTSFGSVASAVGLCWGALVVWLTLLRPTLRAHPDHLLLRNILRDTEVPWHLVDDVVVRHTLRVYVDDDVHHGVSMSRSTRQMLRQGRPDAPRSVLNILGNRSMEEFSHSPTLSGTYQSAMDYPDFVETRLMELATKRAEASRQREAVTVRWAAVVTATFALVTLVAAAMIVVAAS